MTDSPAARIEWQPVKPRLRPLRLAVSWVVAAASVYVAAGLVAGVAIDDPGGAFLVAAVIAVVNAVLPPLIAALRLPFTLVTGFLLVLFADAGALMLADELFPEVLRDRLVRRRAARRAGDGGGLDRDPGADRDQRRRRVHAAGGQAGRPPPGRRDAHRRARDHLPRDRRPRRCRSCATRCATAAPRTWPAGSPSDGYQLCRVGDRPLLADRRQPGRDPARLERGHPRLPLGREGDADDDDLLGARRLRRDRAPPRRPAIGLLADGGASRGNLLSGRGRRGDPHGQPDRGREAGQPRLPRLPRQRLQRHPGAGAVRLGGGARVDGRDPGDPPRRAPARPPRRHLPVPARGDVRDRPRPDRLRRAHAT